MVDFTEILWESSELEVSAAQRRRWSENLEVTVWLSQKPIAKSDPYSIEGVG